VVCDPITVDQSWLEILTPPTPDSGPGAYSRNPTTLESVIMDSGLLTGLSRPGTTETEVCNAMVPNELNRTVSLEWLLSLLFSDAISREGSASVLNTTGAPSDWILLDYHRVQNFDNMIIEGGYALEFPDVENLTDAFPMFSRMLIGGYAYRVSSNIDYWAVATLLAHIVLATWHTLSLFLKGRSSACWDTAAELVALAQNSRPAPIALSNTSAGIKRLRAYDKVARIRATKIMAEGEIGEPK
jgi:hypothetical protein